LAGRLVIQLRDYQLDSLAQLRRNLSAGCRAQILQLATGGGKTAVASVIAQGAVAKGNRVFFVVDSIELVDQALARFTADGMACGVIQGQHWQTDYAKPVQVATIQTLRKRWGFLSGDLMPDVLIIDECHVFHDAHRKIVNQCKAQGIPVIGLSATPFRKGLGKVFDRLVVGATTASLTEQGYLVPARCYAPNVPDLTGVKTSGGDWQADALAEVMGDAQIVGDVVDHWKRLAEGRKTIVFAANVAHSKHLRSAFRAAGVAADHIDGYERDPEVREAVIDRFRSGETQVLCNVAVLTKGFDAPEVSCVVLARPTKSLMLHIQMIGRGLRPGGESDCLILDHAGNVLRNGLPTDALPSELDDGSLTHDLDRRQKDKNDPKDTPCSSCGFVSTKHKCPACGFAPERREDVEVINGELYEVTRSAKKMGRAKVEKLYCELLGYAELKGFKPGWAWHKCVEYAGDAPPKTFDLGSLPPSPETQKIITHLNIRRAKRRAA
jgi:superfamily II DNA or RNA helicase